MQSQFPTIPNHHNSTTIQVNAIAKINGLIGRCHAPREKVGHKHTGLSISNDYSCSCNKNHYSYGNDWASQGIVVALTISELKLLRAKCKWGERVLMGSCATYPIRGEFHDVPTVWIFFPLAWPFSHSEKSTKRVVPMATHQISPNSDQSNPLSPYPSLLWITCTHSVVTGHRTMLEDTRRMSESSP